MHTKMIQVFVVKYSDGDKIYALGENNKIYILERDLTKDKNFRGDYPMCWNEYFG